MCVGKPTIKLQLFHQKNILPAQLSLAFAVCCRCNEDERQIGWIKESDKEQSLDFAGNVELKDLNVTGSLMKIREEHKAIEVEMKISY